MDIHTILHIDDSQSNRYTVKRMMEKHGFKVISANDGKSGLEMVYTKSPDLIILDVQLPDISGIDICLQLKSNPLTKSIPILQTSAILVSNESKIAGLNSGADGYLTQPLESPVLLATVNSVLRTKMAEKRALRATQSRDEMLAIVSHDLRNPLSHILLQANVMEKQIIDGKYDPEIFKAKLQKIDKSCLRINRLIKDLMDVSQMDEGKFSVSFEPIDTNRLISLVMETFEEVAVAAEIKLSLKQESENVSFDGDRERLLQMLGNLITNSIKFTDAGGSITLTTKTHNEMLVIELEDTGHGIEQTDLQHIFNRYWQGSLRKKTGVGLGLSIVKGIVDAHKGFIDLESKVAVGTKFIIRLPLKHW